MPMFLLVILGLILGLLLLCITYVIPIVLIILIAKGVTQAWLFLFVWFICFMVAGLIREVHKK